MTFSRIYRDNEWHGIETRSGPGSHLEPTRRPAQAIVRLVGWLGVRSVLDVGAGEGNWMPDLPGYIGVDVAPEAIEEARRRHPDRAYAVANIIYDDVPASELVIVRDVVQHLTQDTGIRLLLAAAEAGRWLLASTYLDGENVVIEDGDAYRPDLTAPPFSFPPPLILIPDGYVYHDGDVVRDRGKMLGLWERT